MTNYIKKRLKYIKRCLKALEEPLKDEENKRLEKIIEETKAKIKRLEKRNGIK